MAGVPILTAAVVAGSAYLTRAPLLGWVGGWLIRSDPLEASDAIAVLAGSEFGEREIEAADLYREGYADRIVLSVGRESPGAVELARRGVTLSNLLAIRQQQLEELGVPRDAQVVLPGRPESTFDEAVLFAEWCDAQRIGSLIVVTSAFHTARAGFIFDLTFGDRPVRLTVRPARLDDFTADSWWRRRTTLRTGLFELQRLAFYRLAYW